jgi:hypothetical protein
MDDDPCFLGFAFVKNDGDALAVLCRLRSFNKCASTTLSFLFLACCLWLKSGDDGGVKNMLMEIRSNGGNKWCEGIMTRVVDC